MKLLRLIFDRYTLFVKKLSTFIGTFFIYFTAILVGKIIHLFVHQSPSEKWQKYQSGQASDKMF
jgi:hypothetical protein